MTGEIAGDGDEQIGRDKLLAARAALRWVRSGMTLGLGSGSTAELFIRALGERVRAGDLRVEGVGSSRRSEEVARAAGIPLIAPRSGLKLDLAVDGADEITPELDLLKGRGGAMLREKIVVQASRYFLVIADSSKRVERLGMSPIPVEVAPFALPWAMDRIAELGGQPVLRGKGTSGEPFVTDQQNCVVDCRFERLDSAAQLDERLMRIAGVVGHGLFLGCAQAALIGEGGEVFVLQAGRAAVRLADFGMGLG